MAKGKIGVTTENIFPVIKKFLYSDHALPFLPKQRDLNDGFQ